MTKVYDQFDATFANITAMAVLKDGAAIGRVVIKHGAACNAFVHLTGSQMAKGQARGGGYDRASAAVRAAITKLDKTIADEKRAQLIDHLDVANVATADGCDWTKVFANAGFQIVNVI